MEVFFPPAGPGRVLYMSAQAMVLGISVPAFPLENMQQAESAGSSMAPSAGCSMAPSEHWRGVGTVPAVSVSSVPV